VPHAVLANDSEPPVVATLPPQRLYLHTVHAYRRTLVAAATATGTAEYHPTVATQLPSRRSHHQDYYKWKTRSPSGRTRRRRTN
jgi:hypothetical protein